MKKKIFIILMMLVISFNITYGNEKNDEISGLTEKLIIEQLDTIDLTEIEELIDSMNNENTMTMLSIA